MRHLRHALVAAREYWYTARDLVLSLAVCALLASLVVGATPPRELLGTLLSFAVPAEEQADAALVRAPIEEVVAAQQQSERSVAFVAPGVLALGSGGNDVLDQAEPAKHDAGEPNPVEQQPAPEPTVDEPAGEQATASSAPEQTDSGGNDEPAGEAPQDDDAPPPSSTAPSASRRGPW